MTSVTAELDATPAEVWRVMAHGQTYADWVVGASRIREVDANWPEVGSKIHHVVGVLPIHIRDNTEVIESQNERYLRLRARVRPLGSATITFTLARVDGKTQVLMDEVVDRGLAAKFYSSLMRMLIRGRNHETLRRLETLAVEGRARYLEHAGADRPPVAPR